MPTVDDYAPLAPFTLDELVDAANAILRDVPSLQIRPRTVRFYISKGLLPSPSGGPKFARYGIDHLAKIVGLRRSLDAGIKLDDASEAFESGTPAPAARPATSPSIHLAMESENRSRYSVMRRIRLTSSATLEIDADADLNYELRLAALAIEKMIAST